MQRGVRRGWCVSMERLQGSEAADALGVACMLLPECGTLKPAAVRASPRHTCVCGATRADVCSLLAVWGRAAHVFKCTYDSGLVARGLSRSHTGPAQKCMYV